MSATRLQTIIEQEGTSPMWWRWEIRDAQTGATLRYGHKVCYDDAHKAAEKALQRESVNL